MADFQPVFNPFKSDLPKLHFFSGVKGKWNPTDFLEEINWWYDEGYHGKGLAEKESDKIKRIVSAPVWVRKLWIDTILWVPL